MLAMMPPFAPLRLLDDVLALDAIAANAGCRLSHEAPIVSTQDDKYIVSVSAPGVSPADVTIEALEGPRLAVRGRTETDAHTHFVNHCLALPPNADAESATAEAADGVLTISVPKKAPARPVRIEIGAADDETTSDEEETAKPYTTTVVAPGFSAQDLEINAEGRMIVVQGESKRTGTRLARRLSLPRDADVTAATAVHVDGILTLTVPKKSAAEPKRIAVDTALAAAKEADRVLV